MFSLKRNAGQNKLNDVKIHLIEATCSLQRKILVLFSK